MGLSLEDVRSVLVAANVNQPKGNLDGPRQDYTLATNDQLFKAASFTPLVIAYDNGAPVRLVDVAHVVDGVENAQLAGWANGKRAIILNVQRQPGANVIQVADRVKALLPRLNDFHAGGDRHLDPQRPHRDRARLGRRRAVHPDPDHPAGGGGDLPLPAQRARHRHSRRGRAAVARSAPSGVMYLLGYSLNNLSLMALTISTGFVVDDAIVMIENISRYIEEGEEPFEAALKGAEADRLHDRLAHGLAGGGADPAAVHGRAHRPALPRVRGDAQHRHRGLGAPLA